MKMLLQVNPVPDRAGSFRSTTTTTDYEPDQSQVTTVRESKLACEAPKAALAERKNTSRQLADPPSSAAEEVILGRERAQD